MIQDMFTDQKCEFANETEYDFAQNQRYICLLKSGLVAPPYGFLFYFANGLGILVLFCAISYLIYKYYNKVDRSKYFISFFPFAQKLNPSYDYFNI